MLQHIQPGITTNTPTHDPTPSWYLACLGLLPKEWTSAHKEWLSQTSTVDGHLQGEQWAKQLSQWFIQQSYQIWYHRNQKLHQPRSQQSETNSQLHQHITALYTQKDQLTPLDQKMFHLPLEQRLAQPIHTLKQWFQQTYTTTQKCIQQSKLLLQQGQHDIRNYFPSLQQSHKS